METTDNLVAITVPNDSIEIDPKVLQDLFAAASNTAAAILGELQQAIRQENVVEDRLPKAMAFLASRLRGGATAQFIIQLATEAVVFSEQGETPSARLIDSMANLAKFYAKNRLDAPSRGGRKGPRTRTPDLAVEASQLFSERYYRVKEAAKSRTKHKHSNAWLDHVAIDDKNRAGNPKLPLDIIRQLPLKPARTLALEWTATELNNRHPHLGATDNSVRGLLNTVAKADTATP